MNFFLILLIFCFRMTASAQDLSVELQWSLCEPSAAAFFQKAKVTAGPALKRQVYYAESEELDLQQMDAFARTRVEGSKIKRSVKRKYARVQDIPWDLVDELGIECEKDAYVTQSKYGCSLKSKPSSAQEPLDSESLAYLNFDVLPLLKNWGPVESNEWNFKNKDSRELVLETMSTHQGYFSMELSLRVPVAQEAAVSQEIRQWILTRKLTLCPLQQGKTGELLKHLIQTHQEID